MQLSEAQILCCTVAAHDAVQCLRIAAGEEGIRQKWDDVRPGMQVARLRQTRLILAGRSPAELHAQFCDDAREAGWTYGPRRDESSKTHPSLVDYGELPLLARVQDELYARVVIDMRLALATLEGGSEVRDDG